MLPKHVGRGFETAADVTQIYEIMLQKLPRVIKSELPYLSFPVSLSPSLSLGKIIRTSVPFEDVLSLQGNLFLHNCSL